VIRVALEKAASGVMPDSQDHDQCVASRGFLDGLFVAHVGEFEGAGRGTLVAPGPFKIKVALPGCQNRRWKSRLT